MITKISLKNFQKHELLELDLDQVTTVVGPSDTGKSAILRALVWVMTNRPSVKGLVREGEEDCRALVEVDGRTIVRGVKKSKNVYTLDKDVYTAFGRDVPTEVADVLNISPASIQRQMDGVFMISLSPGDTAKMLNSVSGLDIVDSMVKKSKADCKEHADGAEELESLKGQVAATKSNLDTLEDIQRETRKVLDLVSESEEDFAIHHTLVELVGKVVAAQQEDLTDEIDAILLDIEHHERITVEKNSLSTVIKNITSLEQDAAWAGQGVALLEQELKVAQEQEEVEVCPTCGQEIQ